MDKDVVHIYRMECCSTMKRNEFESTELRWMKLELVTQTEVKSEREKHIIYHISYHIMYHKSCQVSYINKYIYGIQKDGTDEPICGWEYRFSIENRLVDTALEGKSGTNRESSTEKYTLPYAKQIARWEVAITQGDQPCAL